MRMVYEYARLEQIHSIAHCPKRWSYPLRLIAHLKKVDLALDFWIQPIKELFSEEVEAMEILRGREYQTELPCDSQFKIPSDLD